MRKKCNFVTTLTFGHFLLGRGEGFFSAAAAADSPFANQNFLLVCFVCRLLGVCFNVAILLSFGRKTNSISFVRYFRLNKVIASNVRSN